MGGNDSHSREERLRKSLEQAEQIREAGLEDDPLARELWAWGHSPIARQSERFQRHLDTVLRAPLANARLNPGPTRWPEVNPAEAVQLGRELRGDRPVYIRQSDLNAHTVVVGATGYGKTTLLWTVLPQLLRRGIRITFIDLKNEGRRIASLCPSFVELTLDRVRVNFLEPVGGNHGVYLSAVAAEIGRAFNLRPETVPKLAEVLMRVRAGQRQGEPFPSLCDLEQLLRRLHARERTTGLSTIATALSSLNAVIGPLSRVRRGAPAEDFFQVVVYQMQNVPPRISQLFSALQLLRLQESAREGGHGGGIRRVHVSDEGGLEFGQTAPSSTGYVSPQQRLVTQVRSAGTGLWVGLQNLRQAEHALRNNARNFVFFAVRDPGELRDAVRILGLDPERLGELRDLPVGQAFVRSGNLYDRPVRVRIPMSDAGRYLSDGELARLMEPRWRMLDERCVFSDVEPDNLKAVRYTDYLRPQNPAAHEPPGTPAVQSEKPGSVDPPEPGPTSKSGEEDTPPPREALPRPEPRLFEEWSQYLKEVQAHPDSSVREHIRRLGWSAGKATRVKKELVDNGLVSVAAGPSGGGRRPQILVLTALGRRFLEGNERAARQ